VQQHFAQLREERHPSCTPETEEESKPATYLRLHYAPIFFNGKRFLFGEPTSEGVETVTVVLDWNAGLKR
jgi:hypothetical protein